MQIMKGLLQQAAKALGYRIGRADRWSSTVEDYYPVDPRVRWGYEKPSNPYIRQALEKHSGAYRETLRALAAHKGVLATVSSDPDPARPAAPYWNNIWFQSLDAAALVCLLAERNPARYVEIGSGHSTRFARHTIQQAKLRSRIASIDPEPRAEIDALCDRVSRCRLEDSDSRLFDELEAGDVLFFDGSHRLFQNSDVTVFFLEVLPRLKPGVLVHIHDIFLPDDYPASWTQRLYSEQYILAAMLLCQSRPFKTVLPNNFVSGHSELRNDALALFRTPDGALLPGACFQQSFGGSSFWVETIAG
jgi:hypothetical protein